MQDYFTKTLLQLKDKNLIITNQKVIGNKYIVDIEPFHIDIGDIKK